MEPQEGITIFYKQDALWGRKIIELKKAPEEPPVWKIPGFL